MQRKDYNGLSCLLVRIEGCPVMQATSTANLQVKTKTTTGTPWVEEEPDEVLTTTITTTL